jgi:hypothetical protein
MDKKYSEQKNYREYHCKVWETAKQDTKTYFRSDWRSWIGGAISAVVSGVVVAIIENTLGIANMIPLWLSFIAIFSGTIVGLIGFYIFIFLDYGLWVIPARVFRKLEIKANKYSWDDITIKIFEPKPEDSPTIGLHITNTKPHDVKVLVAIVEITRNWLFEDEEHLPLNLAWASDTKEPNWGEIQLDRDGVDPYFLAIACWLEDLSSAYLIMELSKKDNTRKDIYRKIDRDADYRIKLKWCGEVDGLKMEELYESYHLRFDGKKLYIKKI